MNYRVIDFLNRYKFLLAFLAIYFFLFWLGTKWLESKIDTDIQYIDLFLSFFTAVTTFAAILVAFRLENRKAIEREEFSFSQLCTALIFECGNNIGKLNAILINQSSKFSYLETIVSKKILNFEIAYHYLNDETVESIYVYCHLVKVFNKKIDLATDEKIIFDQDGLKKEIERLIKVIYILQNQLQLLVNIFDNPLGPKFGCGNDYRNELKTLECQDVEKLKQDLDTVGRMDKKDVKKMRKSYFKALRRYR